MRPGPKLHAVLLSAALAMAAASGSAGAQAVANDYGLPIQNGAAHSLSDRNDAFLRPYYNGAGPTAIFRYGRDVAHKRDVFGVVDPTTWRIQFFALDDWVNAMGSKSLAERITWGGACRLPPKFRFWRVHQWPNKIIIQLQPDPLPSLVQDRSRQLVFPKITLDAMPASIAAGWAATRPPLDGAPKDFCGDAGAHPLPATFLGNDTAAEVKRLNNLTFSVTRLAPASGPLASSGFWATTQKVQWKGRPLSSAQELETATSVATGRPLRHILVTARSPETPGLARADVVLIRRSPDPALVNRMTLQLGLSRVKAGQRAVAISSVGEILLIGAADKDDFHIRACHFVDGQSIQPVCAIASEPLDVTAGQDATAPSQAQRPVTTNGGRDAVWSRASGYLTQSYDVVADGLPGQCLLLAPCSVGKNKRWSPLMDMRLATGTVRRRGAPYAQTHNRAGKPSPLGGAADFPYGSILRDYELRGAQLRVFGDIENTSLIPNDRDAIVFGIDCSSFISRLWAMDADYDTAGFIRLANAGTLNRVAQLGDVVMNDAFVINLDGKLNHVVLFRRSVTPVRATSPRRSWWWSPQADAAEHASRFMTRASSTAGASFGPAATGPRSR
jgi:hypothetical protein